MAAQPTAMGAEATAQGGNVRLSLSLGDEDANWGFICSLSPELAAVLQERLHIAVDEARVQRATVTTFREKSTRTAKTE